MGGAGPDRPASIDDKITQTYEQFESGNEGYKIQMIPFSVGMWEDFIDSHEDSIPDGNLHSMKGILKMIKQRVELQRDGAGGDIRGKAALIRLAEQLQADFVDVIGDSAHHQASRHMRSELPPSMGSDIQRQRIADADDRLNTKLRDTEEYNNVLNTQHFKIGDNEGELMNANARYKLLAMQMNFYEQEHSPIYAAKIMGYRRMMDQISTRMQILQSSIHGGAVGGFGKSTGRRDVGAGKRRPPPSFAQMSAGLRLRGGTRTKGGTKRDVHSARFQELVDDGTIDAIPSGDHVNAKWAEDFLEVADTMRGPLKEYYDSNDTIRGMVADPTKVAQFMQTIAPRRSKLAYGYSQRDELITLQDKGAFETELGDEQLGVMYTPDNERAIFKKYGAKAKSMENLYKHSGANLDKDTTVWNIVTYLSASGIDLDSDLPDSFLNKYSVQGSTQKGGNRLKQGTTLRQLLSKAAGREIVGNLDNPNMFRGGGIRMIGTTVGKLGRTKLYRIFHAFQAAQLISRNKNYQNFFVYPNVLAKIRKVAGGPSTFEPISATSAWRNRRGINAHLGTARGIGSTREGFPSMDPFFKHGELFTDAFFKLDIDKQVIEVQKATRGGKDALYNPNNWKKALIKFFKYDPKDLTNKVHTFTKSDKEALWTRIAKEFEDLRQKIGSKGDKNGMHKLFERLQMHRGFTSVSTEALRAHRGGRQRSTSRAPEDVKQGITIDLTGDDPDSDPEQKAEELDRTVERLLSMEQTTQLRLAMGGIAAEYVEMKIPVSKAGGGGIAANLYNAFATARGERGKQTEGTYSTYRAGLFKRLTSSTAKKVEASWIYPTHPYRTGVDTDAQSAIFRKMGWNLYIDGQDPPNKAQYKFGNVPELKDVIYRNAGEMENMFDIKDEALIPRYEQLLMQYCAVDMILLNAKYATIDDREKLFDPSSQAAFHLQDPMERYKASAQAVNTIYSGIDQSKISIPDWKERLAKHNQEDLLESLGTKGTGRKGAGLMLTKTKKGMFAKDQAHRIAELRLNRGDATWVEPSPNELAHDRAARLHQISPSGDVRLGGGVEMFDSTLAASLPSVPVVRKPPVPLIATDPDWGGSRSGKMGGWGAQDKSPQTTRSGRAFGGAPTQAPDDATSQGAPSESLSELNPLTRSNYAASQRVKSESSASERLYMEEQFGDQWEEAGERARRGAGGMHLSHEELTQRQQIHFADIMQRDAMPHSEREVESHRMEERLYEDERQSIIERERIIVEESLRRNQIIQVQPHDHGLRADAVHKGTLHHIHALHLLQTDNNVAPVMGRVHMVRPAAGFSDKHFMVDMRGDINAGHRVMVEKSKRGPFRDRGGRSTIMDSSAHIMYRNRRGTFEITVRRNVTGAEYDQMMSKLSMHRMYHQGTRVTIVKGSKKFALGFLRDLDLNYIVGLVSDCVGQYGHCGLELSEELSGTGPIYKSGSHGLKFKSNSRRKRGAIHAH